MRRFAILMVCVASLSCGDDDPTNPWQGGEIYPLAIGNSWTYEVMNFDSLGNVESLDTISASVVRDTVIDGETWYVTEGDGEEGIHIGYCIIRSNGFYSNWPDEELLYKYPARVGDQYMVEDDTVIVENLDESVTVPAGEFDCVRYSVHTIFPIRVYQKLCPNIGPVAIELYMEKGSGILYLALRIRLQSYSLH
jgi:hypothetical protein